MHTGFGATFGQLLLLCVWLRGDIRHCLSHAAIYKLFVEAGRGGKNDLDWAGDRTRNVKVKILYVTHYPLD